MMDEVTIYRLLNRGCVEFVDQDEYMDHRGRARFGTRPWEIDIRSVFPQ